MLKVFKAGLKNITQSKTGAAGLAVLLVIICISIAAPLIAPYDPAQANITRKLVPPSWAAGGTTEFLLGTDNLGRDIWSRIVHGSRVSLIVGFCSVAVSGFIGIALGLIAGYYGRWIDAVIMRIVDAFLAIPTILFMMLFMFVLGEGIGTLIFVIGITGWVSYTRMVRSEVLSVRERDYVRAARVVGAKDSRIIRLHIMPNVISSFIVISTLSIGRVIISEAALSFLGLGIQSPAVSWGGMLSDGRQYLATNWWVATFPGIAITITVLAIIFVGDWLRDWLDPKLN
ncbi:peptide/nickel transport system permease protein [Paenibacillus algorifonticola]|uniref:Peptide/nickel transport system permease protein n=1 Tax=Paenibacillus algorifonticola TaxID=684063 RepID=A0A1I2BXT8_9BACL|nr:ABC transporter permease [Paenibacillus algorifonticola]SFE60996.1 peptide/nickel transport system permease protein [Paenibacillus algorifonticola]